MKDEEEHQYFLDVNLKSLPIEKRKRTDKRFVIAKANHNLEEFIWLLFEILGTNSIEIRRVFVHIIRTLRELEKKDVCCMHAVDCNFLFQKPMENCCLVKVTFMLPKIFVNVEFEGSKVEVDVQLKVQINVHFI